MNKKKYILKMLSFMLCFIFVINNILAVNGTNLVVTDRNYEQIEVIYNATSSFSVIIPKQIVLNANKQSSYPVQVTGDIAFNQRVYVAPIDAISQTDNIDFYMKDQTSNSKKANVVATVTQSKVYWNSADVANSYKETNNNISAPDLSAGSWRGTFQVEIALETEEHIHDYVDGVCTGCGGIDPNHNHNYEDGSCTICGKGDPNAEHTHEYVDGKCECGEIDPDHEHIYENGSCTICGDEKTDPYEIAPASAYSNWNYTLDDVNNTITLNYYTGSETDVIVYGSYEIDGKVYKTQIASNPNPSDYRTSFMFNGDGQSKCKNIRTITFSDKIDTSTCTDMQFMFNNCTALTSIDFGNNFNTSNVISMSHMYQSCTSLTSIDVSSFDTSNVTDMSALFYICSSLTNINGLENFDTSKVTNMYMMFASSPSIVELDVSSFDTRNVTNMMNMFASCASLTELDLSSFDTRNATDMRYMFSCSSSVGSSNLKTIYVTEGKWVTSQAKTTGMFNNCGTSSVTYK